MLNSALEYVSNNPCSADAHEKLADEYFKIGRWMPAIAEYRTSSALGGKSTGTYFNLAMASRQGYDNNAYSHNTCYRLKTISEHLMILFGHDAFSILDIGGGEGDLSLFLPNTDYVLAEPLVNGISGLGLPFSDKSFDCVVACHVLEHIPNDLRESFLDQLCKKAKCHVILLNPFQGNNSNLIEQLVYELSGAEWAKEHLESALPEIEDMVKFATDRGIKYRIIPNGSQAVTAAAVFLDYFAGLSGREGDWIKVNQLLNKYSFDEIQNVGFPNAYLIEFDVRPPGL